eukprot:NODE_58_length_28395_cov_1.465720.p16 type:complete len:246 gc:universal NODE_58_length_28395_cov_1.465720:2408-1671(-)
MEIPLEKVFVAQKMMIAKCNIIGKPVICATQMLESMTNSPRPTRAECSDVANAVLDGADCVMLSGETAKGKFPVESVKMMHQLCVEGESSVCYPPLFLAIQSCQKVMLETSETIASSAVNACIEQQVSAIVVLTTTGTTARLVAKYRPQVPIITVTKSASTARQCHLYRGCYPVLHEMPKDRPLKGEEWQNQVDERLQKAIATAIERKLLKVNDLVLVIHGWAGGSGKTNTIRIVKADEGLKLVE